MKSASRMQALTLHATDGEIGRVEEFYFDDETWTIRYLIVNTSGWLSRNLVLISPVFLGRTDWETKQLHVALTRKQIENSPAIDTHRPVSRQHEADYMNSFGAAYYWGGSYMWGVGAYPADLAGVAVPVGSSTFVAEPGSADSHLRSTAAVTGYGIQATDGAIGHVKDFIVDEDTWGIRYLEVDTRNWLPGKLVLIAPEWAEEISWSDATVSVGLPREAIKNAPEYLESIPIGRGYESQLHEYYGRLPYWVRETGRAHVEETRAARLR